MKFVIRKRIFGNVDLPREVVDLVDDEDNDKIVACLYPCVREKGLQICSFDLDLSAFVRFIVGVQDNVFIPLKKKVDLEDGR